MTAADLSTTSANPEPVDRAYRHCLSLARSHYENFPVASLLVPKELRGPIAAIYAFARNADDIADEGNDEPFVRLARLQGYRDRLQALARGEKVNEPVFIAIADSIRRYSLPISLFDDLLTAFIRDVGTTRYATADEVLDYCRYSANPVGRLLLYLYGVADDANLRDADAICTALQLINFLQDLEQDYRENNRIYIPQQAMQRHGIDESWFAQHRNDTAIRALIDEQIDQARTLLLQGAPLAWRLRGRFGLEIRLTVAGGLRILQRLAQSHENVFSRPRLQWADKVWMFKRALTRRPVP